MERVPHTNDRSSSQPPLSRIVAAGMWLYRRPPVSWTKPLAKWLFAPYLRWRAEREQARADDLRGLAQTMDATGMDSAARLLRQRAAQIERSLPRPR